jgi:hypothetical protein
LVRLFENNCQPGKYAIRYNLPKSLDGRRNGMVFSVIIRRNDERLPPGWEAEISYHKLPRYELPYNLELTILKTPPGFKLHETPIYSRSGDSDALYLGHLVGKEEGMLLQYLVDIPHTTGDVVAHTSAHEHDCQETFYALHGSSEIWLQQGDGNFVGKRFGKGQGDARVFTVEPGVKHPLVSLTPSLTLLVMDSRIVEDQIRGKSLHHKNELPFREVYSELLPWLVNRNQ